MRVLSRLSGGPSVAGLAVAVVLSVFVLFVSVSAVRSPVPVDETPYPVFGLIVDFSRKMDYTCNVPLGYLTGLFTRSLDNPVMPAFDLPFPDSGDFVDGVVAIDFQNEVIFTYITSFEPEFRGGWLVGMKLYMGSFEGQYYTSGGLIFATALPSDTALYSIDFDPSTNAIIGWSAVAHGKSFNSKLLRINYKNGTVDTLYEIVDAFPTSSSFINDGIHYSMIYTDEKGQITGAALYAINTQTGELVSQMNLGLTSPLLYTGRWVYNTATSTLFTTFYNNVTSGVSLATLDVANNFALTQIGDFSTDKLEGSGLFAINTKTDLAYIVTEAVVDERVNNWLLVVNSTTGHLIERRNTTSNTAMFITYVPWIDFLF